MNKENEEEIEYISKSQMKREMLTLQELGEKLVELNAHQLSQIDLPEELATAITQAQAIKKHGAKRRQLQFIGRLMRSVDAENIQQQLDKITQHSAEAISQHHRIEQWRERLLADGDDALTEFINTYPEADRQQLRTLIRSAIQERLKNKPPRFYRKIFQFIKQYVETST
jgi:ribosome-associated protein